MQHTKSAKGIYQVLVEKTAFETPMGKYHFVVMLFGLSGAPAMLQSDINIVLAGRMEYCAAYIGDIRIYSKSGEEHIKHVESVLEQLRLHELTTKCHSARKECTLGQRVGGNTYKWDQGNVE